MLKITRKCRYTHLLCQSESKDCEESEKDLHVDSISVFWSLMILGRSPQVLYWKDLCNDKWSRIVYVYLSWYLFLSSNLPNFKQRNTEIPVMFVQIVQYHKCHSAMRTLPERYFPFVCHLRIICTLWNLAFLVITKLRFSYFI